MKKLVILCLSVIILMFVFTQTSTYASSLLMSTSKSEITVGDTVSVTVSFGQKICTADISLSFDSSKFIYTSVSAGSANVSGSTVKVSYYDNTGGSNPISSITFSFTSKATGLGTFSAKCSNTANSNAEIVTISGSPSKSVTVKEKVTTPATTSTTTSTPKTTTTTTTTKSKTTTDDTSSKTENTETLKSNNNNLSAINIEGFSLTPEFNKDTTKYYLSVNQEVNNINISTELEDSKAKSEITGNENLEFGINTITIKVTAEDETIKEYIIEVNKQDNSLGLSSLSISQDNKVLDLSPTFDKNTLDYMINTNDASQLDIEALANYEDASITIIGNEKLKNGENTITITVQKDEETKIYTITVNNSKKGIFEKIQSFFGNTWIVFVVSFCALIQSSIAIYYAVITYKNSK